MLSTAPRNDKKIPFSITSKAVSLFVAGKYRTIPSSHPNFQRLCDEMRKPHQDYDLVFELADIATFIARKTFGEVQISDDKVRWRGQEVHGVIVDRILTHLKLDYDLTPLVNFLAKVQQNPVESARTELFEWLESGNCPITPDGNFLAFKKVRKNYKDVHSGTFDNSVGQVCSMPRENVDTNRRNECSRGLHFCSHGYLSNFSGDRVMIVEVDPGDVCAIPKDYNRQKGRTWRYTVIGEIEQQQASTYYANTPVVSHIETTEDAHVGQKSSEEPEFAEGDLVVCIETGDYMSLTPGIAYRVSDASCGMVEIEEDDDGDRFDYDANLFRKATTEEADQFEAEFLAAADDAEASAEEVVTEDTAITPKPKTKAERQFTSKGAGKTFLESELLALVEEHGKRGTSRITGVPDTTLRGWLKIIQG